MTTRTIRLNQRDIFKLAKDLNNYANSLNEKCREFAQKLIDIGINVAMFRLSNGYGDAPKDADFGVEIDGTGNIVKGVMSLKGKGVLFWEFGAGNKYNGMTSSNPKAKEFSMDIGSYPGQTHVPVPGFWFYKDESGNTHYSIGTQASMPMFSASVEMAEKIEDVAREVFGDG